MANKYIILRNSVEQATWDAYTPEQKEDPLNFQGKKFKVVSENGFSPGMRSTDSFSDTVGGKIDVALGSLYYEWRGTIRTKHTLESAETNDHYGSRADLETYYKYRNPSPDVGDPSNIITLVDNDGVEHHGVFKGDFVPAPLTTIISGTEAHFMIPVQFIELEEIAIS